MHLGQKDLLEYVGAHNTPPADYLNDLERATYRRVINGKMMSGRQQGRMLAMISKLIRPKTILEIGTFTGYSALCLAEGLDDDGRLHTIERNDELCAIQDEFWNRSPYKGQIIRHVGNAVELIDHLDIAPELIFLDAEKTIYWPILDHLRGLMPSGSLLLADNVLWHGKVLKEWSTQDDETQAIHRFNEQVKADPQFETVILPMRDGISMIRKR